MNPGPVEEAGKAAGGFIEALKAEPLSLALVVMNLALLAFFYVILQAVAAQREREVNLLYKDNKEVRDLMAKCIVPSRSTHAGDAPLKPIDDQPLTSTER